MSAEFEVALLRTEYANAIKSLAAISEATAKASQERDSALQALARVRALCDSNAGCATRDGALMVSTIRAAMKGLK